VQSLSKLPLTGVILAGGKSSRMKTNKCLIFLNNRRLIEIILLNLKEIFEEIFIVTNSPELYFYTGIPLLGDIYPFKGPMAGIHVALKNSKNDVFAFACDMPFINREMIYKLAENHIYGKKTATVPSFNGEVYPLPGIYSRRVLDKMEKLLRDDKLGMRRFLDDTGACVVEVANLDKEGLSFININTEKDLEKIKSLIQRR